MPNTAEKPARERPHAIPFFVYILRCVDGSYYTGQTDDLERRLAMHYRGTILGYTSERLPVELLWCEDAGSRENAIARERQIKGWSRRKKQALIDRDWDRVSTLARRHGPIRRELPPPPGDGAPPG